MNEHIFKPNCSRESINDTIDHLHSIGADHLLPIFEAVRDHGVAFCNILQDAGRFSFPLDKPTIILFGDDLFEAKGPSAFHRKSVRAILAKISSVIVISCDAEERFYAPAAANAAMLRQHVLIVETLPRFEADWVNYIQNVRPGLPTLLCGVLPAGGVQ
jgi:hypothetical protein